MLWIGARTTLARGMVAGWIEDAAGLPASIESLGLGFFPSPSVDIRGLAIAQPPGFGEEPFVTVGRLRIRIPWSGIFDATDVHEIAASDATVRLVVEPRRRRQLVEARRRAGRPARRRRPQSARSLVHRRARARARHDRLPRPRGRIARATGGDRARGRRTRAGPGVSFRPEARRHLRRQHDSLRDEGAGAHRHGGRTLRGHGARLPRLGGRRTLAARGRGTHGCARACVVRRRDGRRRARGRSLQVRGSARNLQGQRQHSASRRWRRALP